MAKKKIKIIRRQFREIKKPSLEEVKPKEKEEEVLEQDSEEGEGVETEGSDEKEEQESGEEFAFDDFSDIERKAPSLEPTAARQDELENMLEGIRGKEGKGKEDGGEEKDSFKYDFEKPKYSFSESEDGGAMEELRHVVLKETPSLIEKTHEAGEVHSARIQDSMLETLGAEEYAVKYVPVHKQELLEESEEIKGKKVDVKKYRKER